MSSYRAELRALLDALVVAVPPVRIHIDNQDVLDGANQGRAWCISSKVAESDLWRLVWDQLDRVKATGPVELKKVKDHTTRIDLLKKVISPKEQYGNWLADLAAKASTKHSEALAPASAFERESKKASARWGWEARCAASWVHDFEALDASEQSAPPLIDSASAGAVLDFGAASMRHELWVEGGQTLCRRCGLRWGGLPADPSRFPSRCTGFAAGRAAANATGNIDYIWLSTCTAGRNSLCEDPSYS